MLTARPTTARRMPGSLALAVAVAAPLLFMALVYFLPALNVAGVSFEGGGSAYRQALGQESTSRVLLRTLVFAVEVTLLSLLTAFPVACVATRARPRWSGVIIFVATMPLWTSLLVRTIAWQGILGRGGVVDTLLRDVIGVSGAVLSPSTFGAIAGSVYVMVPYMFLVLYAALRSLSPNLVEAAMTLGGSRSQAFVSVFLPSSMRGVGAGVLLVFILSVGFFVPPALLGGPGDRTIAMLIQQRVNAQADFPGGAVLAMLLFVATVLCIVAGLTVLGGVRAVVRSSERRHMRLTTSTLATMAGRVAPLLRPLESRLVWNGFTALVLVLLAAPLIIIVPLSLTGSSFLEFPPSSWSLEWFRTVAESDTWVDAAMRSLLIATMAGIIATAVGTTSVLAMRRLRGAGNAAMLGLLLAPAILPVIVYAIGAYSLATALHGVDTIWMLVLTQSALAVPFVVLTVRAAAAAIPASLEDAARVMGASRTAALRTVTLPLLTGAMISGAVLAFLTAFDEVVVSLFLSGVDNTTLPKALWTASTLEVTPTIFAVGVYIIVFVVLIAGCGQAARWLVARRSAASAAPVLNPSSPL